MDNLIDIIGAFIEKAWEYLCEVFVTVILDTIIGFFSEVVDYFTNLRLEEGVHIPFIFGESSPLAAQLEGLKENSQGRDGVYEGVFNTKTDQLDSLRWVGGQGMDDDITKLIQNGKMAIIN